MKQHILLIIWIAVSLKQYIILIGSLFLTINNLVLSLQETGHRIQS